MSPALISYWLSANLSESRRQFLKGSFSGAGLLLLDKSGFAWAGPTPSRVIKARMSGVAGKIPAYTGMKPSGTLGQQGVSAAGTVSGTRFHSPATYKPRIKKMKADVEKHQKNVEQVLIDLRKDRKNAKRVRDTYDYVTFTNRQIESLKQELAKMYREDQIVQQHLLAIEKKLDAATYIAPQQAMVYAGCPCLYFTPMKKTLWDVRSYFLGNSAADETFERQFGAMTSFAMFLVANDLEAQFRQLVAIEKAKHAQDNALLPDWYYQQKEQNISWRLSDLLLPAQGQAGDDGDLRDGYESQFEAVDGNFNLTYEPLRHDDKKGGYGRATFDLLNKKGNSLLKEKPTSPTPSALIRYAGEHGYGVDGDFDLESVPLR